MIYTWKCKHCGAVIDRVYALSADKPATIPCECGSTMYRVYRAPAVKYKGEGFYTNDQWHPVEENPDDLK
jgi:predicted nucleic acid-binding Zn ribbon protein